MVHPTAAVFTTATLAALATNHHLDQGQRRRRQLLRRVHLEWRHVLQRRA